MPFMSVQPGWYTDPYDESRIRFWDGSTWTDRSAERGSTPDAGTVPSGSEAATGVLPAQDPQASQGAADPSTARARSTPLPPRTAAAPMRPR